MDDKNLVQLQVEFSTFKKHTEESMAELKKENEELSKRVMELEKNTEKTDFQYEQIMKTLDKLNDETIPNLVKQIQELKDKPAQKYNLIATTAIGAIVGGIVSFIINNILH